MAQAGVPGSGVIDGEASMAAQDGERVGQASVVDDGHVLGDLDDDVPVDVLEHGHERLDRERQGRRHVEAQPGPAGQRAGGPHRRAQARHLELETQSGLVGPVELQVGARAVREPGERLEADDASTGQLPDDLEDGLEALLVDDALEILSNMGEPLSRGEGRPQQGGGDDPVLPDRREAVGQPGGRSRGARAESDGADQAILPTEWCIGRSAEAGPLQGAEMRDLVVR